MDEHDDLDLLGMTTLVLRYPLQQTQRAVRAAGSPAAKAGLGVLLLLYVGVYEAFAVPLVAGAVLLTLALVLPVAITAAGARALWRALHRPQPEATTAETAVVVPLP